MNDNIGFKIKNIRNEKKITQTQLAELLNKSVITIRKWESGERTPSIDTIKKIAKALDVPLFRLTGEREIADLFAGVNGLELKSIIGLLNNSDITIDQKKDGIDLLLKSKSIRLTRELFKSYGYRLDLSCSPIIFIQNIKTKKDIARMTFDDLEKIATSIELSLSGIIYKTINDFSISDTENKIEKQTYDLDNLPQTIKNFINQDVKGDTHGE